MHYNSTRSNQPPVTASQAILKGLSEDGGLFVPEQIPCLEQSLDELSRMDYREVAFAVMKLYLSDFTDTELKDCIDKAYDDKFDHPEIAPLKEAGGVHYLELFHGATIAFKDMALSLLPHLLTTAARKNRMQDEIVILTATSGDTGKAALSGFADVPGIRIVVFYPKNGVSPVQEKQMVTQKGDNTYVVGVHGNFDDTQTGVKKIFNDRELAAEMKLKGFVFSSANSINIGRLVPQIAYYVYACAVLRAKGRLKDGETVNVVVPTGNFGNILAAYYARRMGLPLGRLICASNDNRVLYDFFATGVYDRRREFFLTSSPSMDILISSNLERLIYHIAGNDARSNAELMGALSERGHYRITDAMREELTDFYGNFATEAEAAAAIKKLYQATGYVIDPHTAVAACVYEKYRQETGDGREAVIVATASPYKFSRSVMAAIDGIADEAGDYAMNNETADAAGDFALIDRLAEASGVPVPAAIEEIRNAPVRHTKVCEVDEMKRTVTEFLGM